MARKGHLKAIYRWTYSDPYYNDIQWTLVFEGEGSLDFHVDGTVVIDQDDVGFLDEDPDWEKVWP